MTEYIVLVAAAIVIEGDKVLLGRRGPNVPLNGCWEFPGGKIEYWETPQECLERELFEELGVASKAGAIIAESDYQYNGSHWIVAFDSRNESLVNYVTNMTTNIQYRWNGDSWAKSYEGFYSSGKWQLVI